MRKANYKQAFLLFTVVMSVLSQMVWYMTGLSSWRDNPDTVTMFVEMIIIFGMTYLACKRIRSEKVLFVFLLGEMLFFSYIHQMLAPVLVNALYFIWMLEMGLFLAHICRCEKTVEIGFSFGVICIILLECLLSLCGKGTNLIFASVIAVMGSLCLVYNEAIVKKGLVTARKSVPVNWKDDAFAIAVIVVVFALLIGRCNNALDYDGYWYGLQGEYILNDGDGIFDRIMKISTPSVYPKGYELLTLPLLIFPSYAFRTTFNIFIGILIVVVTNKVVRRINSDSPLIVTAVAATIPGIMSMCTTMKQDSITLLFQLIMISFAIDLFNEWKLSNLFMFVAAFLISLNMKTTALVFSSAVCIVVFIKCFVDRKRITRDVNGVAMFVGAVTCTGFLSLRTYLLCGYPYTSLLNAVWKMLGLKSFPPYIIAEPSASASLSTILTAQGMVNAVKKGVTAFVAPIQFEGVITTHFRLAWGTVLPLCILIYVVYCIICKKGRSKHKFIFSIYVLVWLLSLYSIASLEKNDGNYYMLLYALSFVQLVNIDPIGDYAKASWGPEVPIALIVMANLFVFAMTGWAGAGRFSEIDWLNRGYYNHKYVFAQRKIAEGKYNIYSYFENKQNERVLALGTIENTNLLPGLVENAIEVYGYGGRENFETYESFVEYLRLTETTDIYIDETYDGYIVNFDQYLLDLLDDGYVCGYFEEGKNKVVKIDMSAKQEISEQESSDMCRELNCRYRVQEGELYSDGFLGKYVKLAFENTEEKSINLQITNTDKLSHESVLITCRDETCEVQLEEKEVKTVALQIPQGVSIIEITAEKTFKPNNGDERELSVLLLVQD